jgi:hypothetical protein
VKLHQNAIVADEFGAYFSGGRPEVMRNRFIGGGLDYDRGVEPLFEPNYHYAPLGCRFRLAPGIWCRAMFEAPRGVFDETGFDGDERYGWDADGYERGYLRDGPPLPQSYRPPPPITTTTTTTTTTGAATMTATAIAVARRRSEPSVSSRMERRSRGGAGPRRTDPSCRSCASGSRTAATRLPG